MTRTADGLRALSRQTVLTLPEVVKPGRPVTRSLSAAAFAVSFWERVDQSGGEDACWPWTAGRFDTGYGGVWLDGKSQRAHRIAWILAFGPIPPSLRVLHRCDNPPCCNPGHLFTGTMRDNTADMVRKGRHGRDGLRHLNEEKAAAIREAYAAGGVTLKELGEKYSVTWVAIWKVVHRKTWKDVA